MLRRSRTFLHDCSMPASFSWLPAFDADGETGGGSGETPSAEPATGSAEIKVGPNGYPEKTPVAEMAPEHAVNYWKHAARKHEADKKTALQQVNELKPRAEQFAALEQASKTEADRAVEEALRKGREEGRIEADRAARDRYAPRLVSTHLTAAAPTKGLTAEAITTLAGDPKRFLNDDGDVDEDALAAFIAAIPATTPAPLAAAGPRVSAGQGNRAPVKASGLDEGASLFAERHKGRATSNTQ